LAGHSFDKASSSSLSLYYRKHHQLTSISELFTGPAGKFNSLHGILNPQPLLASLELAHLTTIKELSQSEMTVLPTTFDSELNRIRLKNIGKQLTTHLTEPVQIAVIGGTGLSQLDGFHPVAVVNPSTPWGMPASPITILEHKGAHVAFLARHGQHHQFAPHEVPNRANIAALRSIGVRCVVAFSAVGSLQEDIKPMDFVIPDQAIDRTKGIRPFTFFEGGVVGHVGFADPFDGRLAQVVKTCAEHLQGDGVVLHEGGTVICMGN
jgi:hypothetical protein